MRRLSSRSTWWYKKAYPVSTFGFLALFTAAWAPAVIDRHVPAFTLLIPVGLAILGYVLMRWLVFPLVDEVWMDGEEILVKNGGEEDRFPVTNIVNVDASMSLNPERIVLTLREPCRFGREVIFSPPSRWWRPGRHPLAEELIRRVHRLDQE